MLHYTLLFVLVLFTHKRCNLQPLLHSVDEMGAYDLPAVIDHVVNTTGQSGLAYIGHSLGTTMMYVMASRRPEYVHRVRLMVGLAPAAFFGRYRAAAPRLLLEAASSYSVSGSTQ